MRTNKVIVFDIDGTLANVDHRRHWVASKPKNWAAWNAAMDKDTVHEDIKWMLDIFYNRDDTSIIICSGRGCEHREITEQWLEDNFIHHSALYMRAEKDNRKDSIVKVELLNQIEAEHGVPWLWVDDRTQVVEAIRKEGVRVLQVAPGDF
jgi:FMN phosphatase YigB (HAD superfamily)